MAAKPCKPASPKKPASRAKARPAPQASRAAAHADTGAAAGEPKPTMPVHALGDERIHLALTQRGRLKQGYLKTLCGLQAVSALSPFALADAGRKRCKTCFGKVDAEGRFAG